MREGIISVLLFYEAVISLITIIATCVDKSRSKKSPKRRIPEKSLIFLGILGGATAEYITMKIIRHKTLHKKFMIGLPLIILLHIGIIFAIAYYL